jgi:IMP dehydrogenase
MLGRTLASCDESPGQIIIRNGKRMKYFRGMASTMANISNQERATKRVRPNTNFTAEGVDGVVELKGSVADLLGQVTGALRSGMSYLGARNLDELHHLASTGQIQWAQQTAIGMSETGIRVSTF